MWSIQLNLWRHNLRLSIPRKKECAFLEFQFSFSLETTTETTSRDLNLKSALKRLSFNSLLLLSLDFFPPYSSFHNFKLVWREMSRINYFEPLKNFNQSSTQLNRFCVQLRKQCFQRISGIRDDPIWNIFRKCKIVIESSSVGWDWFQGLLKRSHIHHHFVL